MRLALMLLAAGPLLYSQGRGAAAPPVAPDAAARAAFIRGNYTKFEYRVPMRDGAEALHLGLHSQGCLHRRPHVSHHDGAAPDTTSRPMAPTQWRTTLGLSEFFDGEKFIFVYQDVRGRFMSEGDSCFYHPSAEGGEERTEGSPTRAPTRTTQSTGW